MNFFTRLFKIGQAETNSILNHLEEPISLTEESISDLKAELKKKSCRFTPRMKLKSLKIKVRTMNEKQFSFFKKVNKKHCHYLKLIN